jgi:hypothetical protein
LEYIAVKKITFPLSILVMISAGCNLPGVGAPPTRPPLAEPAEVLASFRTVRIYTGDVIEHG